MDIEQDFTEDDSSDDGEGHDSDDVRRCESTDDDDTIVSDAFGVLGKARQLHARMNAPLTDVENLWVEVLAMMLRVSVGERDITCKSRSLLQAGLVLGQRLAPWVRVRPGFMSPVVQCAFVAVFTGMNVAAEAREGDGMATVRTGAVTLRFVCRCAARAVLSLVKLRFEAATINGVVESLKSVIAGLNVVIPIVFGAVAASPLVADPCVDLVGSAASVCFGLMGSSAAGEDVYRSGMQKLVEIVESSIALLPLRAAGPAIVVVGVRCLDAIVLGAGLQPEDSINALATLLTERWPVIDEALRSWNVSCPVDEFGKVRVCFRVGACVPLYRCICVCMCVCLHVRWCPSPCRRRARG